MQMLTGLAVGLAVCGLAAGGNAQAAKSGSGAPLRYDKPVTLEGRIDERTFGNDALNLKESGFILRLTRPINVAATPGDEYSPAHKNVREIQVAAANDSVHHVTQRLARRNALVRVSGTLFGEQTAHHHRPVLISASAITAAKAGGKRAR